MWLVLKKYFGKFIAFWQENMNREILSSDGKMSEEKCVFQTGLKGHSYYYFLPFIEGPKNYRHFELRFLKRKGEGERMKWEKRECFSARDLMHFKLFPPTTSLYSLHYLFLSLSLSESLLLFPSLSLHFRPNVQFPRSSSSWFLLSAPF